MLDFKANPNSISAGAPPQTPLGELTALPHMQGRDKQVITSGAATRYARRRWQFDSRRIYVRPRTGPQSTHG